MRQYFKLLFSPICFLICILSVMVLIMLMDGIYISKVPPPIPRYGGISLLNLPHFKYVINNDVCDPLISPNYIKAVIIITSHAGNTHLRQAHREALPKTSLLNIGVRRVFLLAVAPRMHNGPYRKIKQKEVDEENKINGDLVQGNFNEAYRNLSYKHIMGLQWASKFCSRAQYIIKMDDDIILDIYKLLKLIPSEANTPKPFLLGYILKGIKPARNPKNKWFVTQKEYSKSFYPPFLSGWMYVTTPAVAAGIVNYTNISNKYKYAGKMKPYQSFFWIDDVFVTGIISQQIRAQLIDLSEYFAVHPQYFQCCIEAAFIQRSIKANKKYDSYSCDFVVGPSGGDTWLLRQVLKEAEKCWRVAERCLAHPNRSDMAKKCIVGRGEAYDWVRRPYGEGKALLKEVKL